MQTTIATVTFILFAAIGAANVLAIAVMTVGELGRGKGKSKAVRPAPAAIPAGQA